MKLIVSKRGLLAVLVIIASLLFVYQFRIESRISPTSSPLTDIQQIDTLREQFNLDQGQFRLILLVSPT